MPEPQTIILLGASTAGKTSLLATMHNYLGNQLPTMLGDEDADLSIYPLGESKKTLNNAYTKLLGVVEKPEYVPLDRLIEGSKGVEIHEFRISCGRQDIDVNFVDSAGGFFTGPESEPGAKEFKECLAKASIIINVLDAAILMEDDLELDEKWNCHQLVSSTLKELYADDERPRLVLFVLTKCEKWLREKKSKELLKRFEAKHRAALQVLKNKDHAVGAVIPVATTGCIEFSYLRKNPETQTKDLVFIRNPNLKFKPRDVDQPLLYSIRFALARYHDYNNGFCAWLKSIFGLSDDFLEQLQALTEHCKDYTIYGNEELLGGDAE